MIFVVFLCSLEKNYKYLPITARPDFFLLKVKGMCIYVSIRFYIFVFKSLFIELLTFLENTRIFFYFCLFLSLNQM